MRSRAGDAAGTTLVELLVALLVLLLALSTVALLATAVLSAFEADPSAADAQQRARGGIQALLDDVRLAGSGFIDAPDLAPGRGLPAVWPGGVVTGGGVLGVRPRTLAAWHAPRGAAHGVLRVDTPAGSTRLSLTRPAFCSAVTASCGFQIDDEVVLYGPHGQVEVATVQQVVMPLELDVRAPLAAAWPAGTVVSAVLAHTYELRADPGTGLSQVVRRLGAGPAAPVIDFVTRFDVEWWLTPVTPAVNVAPGGLEEDASAGPSPPPAGVLSLPAWPAGENCAFARDAAGTAQWRSGAAPGGAAAAPLMTFGDGPWCPSAAAALRWDADLSRIAAVRITLGVAAAANELRPPTALGLARRPGARLVPDLVLETTVRPGRRNGGS